MANRSTKEDTKNRIIDSAKNLFAEQGYLKTTVVDISKQADLSEAALYEYFQGKEDLLLAIPDLWVSDLLTDVQERLFGIKGATNKLRKYLIGGTCDALSRPRWLPRSSISSSKPMRTS